MPVYTYSAADREGRVRRERSHQGSELNLERNLEKDGLVLVRIHKVEQRERDPALSRTIPRSDLIELSYHLSVVTAAGVPLLTGLNDFSTQRASPRVRKLLGEVINDVNNGSLFSEALAKHPGAFGKIFINLVRAGEASGSLDAVMKRFYQEMEWQARIRSRLLQALVYPAVLLAALSGLVLLLLTFLLPRVMGLFPKGVLLPLPTRVLVFCSEILEAQWGMVLALALLAPLCVKLFRLTDRGKYLTDMMLMKLPLLGSLFLDISVARFISTLRTLHGSGVEITRALLIAGESAGNRVIGRRAEGIREEITRGSLLSAAFQKVEEFDSMIKNLVNMSERTGQTTMALQRITDYFDTVIPRRVKKMLSLLEPCIIVAAGLAVGFVLVGTILPIFQLYSNF